MKVSQQHWRARLRRGRPALIATYAISTGILILVLLARRNMSADLLLLIVATIGLLAAGLIVVPRYAAPAHNSTDLVGLSPDKRTESTDARTKPRNDVPGTIVQAIIGIAALGGAFLGWQQLTTDRQQISQQLSLTRQGQASERFTRAIDQLGSPRREAQIGGIYGLEQIAHQAPDNRLQVTEVLVAYVRHRAALPTPKSQRYKAGFEDLLVPLALRSPDVQAALTVLGRRHREDADPPLDLGYLDLRGADLRSADLRGANLGQAELGQANLRGADLRGANLTGAELATADLRRANLRGADFRSASLFTADLREAELDGAILRGSYLGNADLRNTNLHGMDLRNTLLEDAQLAGANLVEVNLSDANLDGADMQTANLKGSIASPSTQWPEGFDWRGAQVTMQSSR